MDQFTEGNTTEHVPYIRCDNLVRIYKSEEIEVMALQGLDLEVEKGELMAIIGKSGSGKSTLLGLLGAMDRPSVGGVYYDGVCLNDLSNKQLAKFRNDHIGFVWQKNSDNLLFYLTVAENIEMPLMFTKMSRKEKRERARYLLDAVGLADKENSFPAMLSGGEQQRVAIARAMTHRPEIIFADEPTGALDTAAGLAVTRLFKELAEREGITIVMTTHDPGLMELGDVVYEIEDGMIR